MQIFLCELLVVQVMGLYMYIPEIRTRNRDIAAASGRRSLIKDSSNLCTFLHEVLPFCLLELRYFGIARH